MKFSILTVLALSVVVPTASAQTLLRTTTTTTSQQHGNDDLIQFDMSACNDIHDEKTCYETTDSGTNDHCVWCDCQAVPSVCVTKDQSESLPSGVFDCKSPDMAGVKINDDRNNEMFQFVDEGRTYHLKETVAGGGVDGPESICDPSSKSISGYMDVKGSKYDEAGDKHLFFWMFEKRGADLMTEEEKDDIPFVVWLTGGPVSVLLVSVLFVLGGER